MTDRGAEGVTTFDAAVVRKMLETAFKDAGTQVEPKAVEMSAEAMRMFVCEAVHRAGDLAQEEARCSADGVAQQPARHGLDTDTEELPSVEIQPEHFLKVLPQLLLDFS